MIWRVKDWGRYFENNRTRDLKRMEWVPIPNKMDGDGYTELLDHPNGAAHFGAWVAIVEIASRCGDPASGCGARGTLLREGARPHDFASLSRLSRIPEQIFKESIPRLIDIGWIEQMEQLEPSNSIAITHMHEGAVIPQEGAVIPQEGAVTRPRAMNGTERNGTEKNSPAISLVHPPNGNGHVKRWAYLSDQEFAAFVVAACRFWPDLIEEDLQKSWQFTWKKFDFEQKIQATQRLQARIESGEESRFVTRPPKYLEEGDWKRPPRQPQQNGRPAPEAKDWPSAPVYTPPED